MKEDEATKPQPNLEKSSDFYDLLWAKITQVFSPEREICETNLIDLSVVMKKAFAGEDEVRSDHAPSYRSLKTWYDRKRAPQRERFYALLHVMFGAGWRFDEAALNLSQLHREVSSAKHPRNREGIDSRSGQSCETAFENLSWRRERIELVGDGARRNSEPLAELLLQIPDDAADQIVPIAVTMTQDVDEIDVETDDGYETFLVSLAGSRLSIEFDDCGAIPGSRLGETDNPVVVPTTKGVSFSGGLWKLPAQKIHQNPLGDEPLFSLHFPYDRPCAFVLTLSCRNRQIRVCQEAKPDEEVISPLREKLIEIYIQQSLKQNDAGIVELTKIGMTRA